MAAGFRDLLEELFAPLGGVVIKRMFGGLGIMKDGMMFALVADDLLYFKGDETTAPKFETEGCERWVYSGKTRAVAMPYWRAPERLFDEPEEFADWARVAFGVAERKKAAGKTKPKVAPKPKAAKPAAAKKRPAAAKKKPTTRAKAAKRR